MPERPADEKIHRAIGALQELSDLFQRRRAVLAAGVGLSDGQWRVLEEIATTHFLPSLFARERSCSPAGVSRTLRQLQGRGLVAAEISESDGRQRRYRLTETGIELMNRLRSERMRAVDRVWRDLDPVSVDQFIDFAERLTARLEPLTIDPAAG